MALPNIVVSTFEPPAGVIGPIHQPRQVREWTLVLSSMGIPNVVRDANPGWVILVSPDDHARALQAIRLYEAENKDWPPRAPAEKLPHSRSLAAPLVMLMLVLFFFVTGPASSSSVWFERGTASSDLILHGQAWRAVTALTLHADAVHVVGNALSGSIFLAAVNRRLGDGIGPFLVVVAGSLGNVMNALWYRTNHLSIGASTAVFAAVGILAATQLVQGRGLGPRPLVEKAAPLVGGLALLGMLGASPHSDLLAHLFGFLAGVAVGLLAGLGIRTGLRGSVAVQVGAALCTVALVGFAWELAFRAS